MLFVIAINHITKKPHKLLYHQFVLLFHSLCSQAMPTRTQLLLLLFAAAVAVAVIGVKDVGRYCFLGNPVERFDRHCQMTK